VTGMTVGRGTGLEAAHPGDLSGLAVVHSAVKVAPIENVVAHLVLLATQSSAPVPDASVMAAVAERELAGKVAQA